MACDLTRRQADFHVWGTSLDFCVRVMARVRVMLKVSIDIRIRHVQM